MLLPATTFLFRRSQHYSFADGVETVNSLRSHFLTYTRAFQIAPEIVQPVENPATAIDREYIANHAETNPADTNLLTFDRAPVAQEWACPLPQGAFVRVFVINEYTTVRALYTDAGDRVGEAVIDSWRPSATYVVAS
jgi:hypothetical protein